MKGLAVLVPVLLVALLSSCASQNSADPMDTCIDVNMDYGLAADYDEARDFCDWLADHEALLGEGQTFEETFSSLDLAREWAETEAAKSDG